MSRQMHPHIRPSIIAAIMRGDSVKLAAYDLGISVSWAYRIAQELGYSATLISREEQKLLAKFRSEKHTKNKTK